MFFLGQYNVLSWVALPAVIRSLYNPTTQAQKIKHANHSRELCLFVMLILHTGSMDSLNAAEMRAPDIHAVIYAALFRNGVS
jgi:hypothetical protein